MKQSDRIRQIVAANYVRPAVTAGKTRFSVGVRDVLRDAEATENFPRGRTPLICEVLQGKKLLKEQGLEIEQVEGPPSKQSPTVVVHYRMLSHGPSVPPAGDSLLELAGTLRGAIKEGADAFVRELRRDKKAAE